MTPVIITLTGPTCSGKTSLAKYMTKHFGVPEIRSFTTRPQRKGEVDGIDYDFVPMKKAEKWVRNGNTVQHVNLKGNLYGSTTAQVREALLAHQVAAIVVEPTGVDQFRRFAAAAGMHLLAVYVNNPVSRLTQRYLKRVQDDSKTPLAFHAARLLGLFKEAEEWPTATDYDIVIDSIDDGSVNEASHSNIIASQLVEHARRLRFVTRQEARDVA